jgi:hypothetical protein
MDKINEIKNLRTQNRDKILYDLEEIKNLNLEGKINEIIDCLNTLNSKQGKE